MKPFGLIYSCPLARLDRERRPPRSKAQVHYGPTREEDRILFSMENNYAIAHSVAKNIKISVGIAILFKKKFGEVEAGSRK